MKNKPNPAEFVSPAAKRLSNVLLDSLLISGDGTDHTVVGFSGSLSSKMDDAVAREDACREYQSSLEDLTFNSKPHINMLTILAEENVQFAKDIVAIIEAQISKAPTMEKLPVLYLVDSIVKNVGGEYLAVFAKNLITSFICVFEKVDENTRKSLFKLRSTWDEVFPLKKLYALDVRVNSLDPAWPIKPLPSPTNAIHVNPKFLKQSEEASSPQAAAPTHPPAVTPVPKPAPQLAPVISQSSLTQEQLIRQQLLAKQKQLLELQQKKIELELEQTKAQLMGQAGFISPAPTASSSLPKPDTVVRPWVPPQPQPDPKFSNRDPRLIRVVPPAVPQPKEQLAVKRESPALPPERRLPEKPTQLDKPGMRKAFPDDKSKSPSPLARSLQNKNKQLEAKFQKSTEGPRKDPRLKKRPQDKAGMSREDEQKEKKRCSDKKDREEVPRGPDSLRVSKTKLVNGSMVTHDRNESSERPDFKTGGNARTHARKRTRSRSPAGSPKRKDRRSPKSKTRSRSPSPSHKPGKPQRIRAGDLLHGKPGRDERLGLKKTKSESRRPKRLVEEHHSESRDSPRSHEGGSKEAKEAHRWRSGWEENKHPKPSEDPHTKAGPQRHKSYSTPTRPSTPRNPKHRLSVDANLQIPEVLNSASKKDLLQRASRRLESGEISLEDFLNMAHQIKHFFQYQEEKQQRTKGWEGPGEFPVKKRSLLSSPPSAQSHPHDAMDPAELSYYEHKSKLRTTRVNRRVMGEETQESQEDGTEMGQGEKTDLISGNPPSHRYSRGPLDRPGERRSKEHEESRPALAPMIEDYNHGKEFPKLKGLRFRRRADPRESSEREWTSPLTERQLYDDREEQKSGYDAPRRYPTSADQRRQEGPSGTGVHRNSSSSVGPEAPPPRFERERLSPLHQKDAADSSPIPRFESPNSEHSDDGPLDVPHSHPPHKPILTGLLRGGPLPSVQQHEDSPGLTPPHEASHPPSRYSGPGHMGPSRSRPGWFEGGAPPGCYNDPQFEGPHHPGPSRFDGGGPPYQVENTDGSGSGEGHHMARGPARGDGMGRFDGSPQGPVRFGGPMDPQPPVTFEGPLLGPGPGPLEGPIQHFNNAGPCSMGFQQQRPLRFEPPTNQMGLMRFEGPGQLGPRFDLPSGPLHGGPAGFDYPPGQQGGPRFAPQHNPQAPVQPMAPPIYDNSIPSQQNFNMGPQRFPDPLNPQFPTGPNMQQPGSFNMQPLPFSHPVPRPFFTPSAPPMGQQQPMNMMNQNFLPQNPGPYGQQTHPVAPPENHFGQVDVNDLLSKLVSNGIIKVPSQADAAPTPSGQSADPLLSAMPPSPLADLFCAEFTQVATAPPAEEEEEEEPEVEEDDFPDLTSFSIENMKQRYESVVTKLYSGNQCCLCSMRFTTAQTDMYADHLDWHFRQNHAGKVASKKVTHRRWYYSLTDWVEFEEIADLEERAKSQFFEKENEEEVQKSQAAAKEKEFQSVRAAKDQVGELCEICQESFETYWVEEEEDWFLKNAIRVDEKNFHPACFEDYKNTSSYLDVTPSPSKLLTEHPLGTFLKMEEEKVTSCDVTVKQEVPSESCELPQEDQNQGQEVLTDPVKSENAA